MIFGIAICKVAYATVANEPLQLNQLIRIGLKRSPTIKKQEAELQIAREQMTAKKGAFFPSINFKSTLSDRDFAPLYSSAGGSENTEYSNYLEAVQPLYTGGALIGGYNFYEQKENIEFTKLRQTEQDVIYKIARTFYDLLQKKKTLEAAQINESVLKKHSDIISRYQKIGRARQTDKLQAELNWLTAQSNVKDMESQYFAQSELLRSLLALESLPEVTPDTDITQASTFKIDPDQAVKIAFSHNPQIISAQLEEENIVNEKKIDLSTDMPQLKISGQYGYKTNDKDNLTDSDHQYSSVLLSLEIPLFSGLSSFAKRRVYEQKKISFGRELEIAKFSLEADLRSTLKELASNEQRLLFSIDTYNKAKYALELASREYQKSLISSSDLINIQRTKYDTDKMYIESQYNYKRSLLKVQWLMGEPLSDIYIKESKVPK